MAARFGEGSSQSREKFAYQVFLSFNGTDVPKKFIDHLHHALKRAGVRTFHDDNGLDRGSDIKLKLYDAIERSKLSIVTFSSGYATSRWCLSELVKINDCRSSGDHLVLPVFYDVDPTVVRRQSGPYKIAFDEHEANSELESHKVESWRVAMRAIGYLAGFVLKNQADGHEAQFIQNIITEVMKKLDNGQLSVPRCIVGVNSTVETICECLQNGSSGVEVGVIYGLGGVGKTTVAKVVYNRSHGKFDGCSFLADIKRASSQHNGMLKIREVIGCRRILLVLDGCDERDEICSIFNHPEWFFPGSKFLITSRSKQLPVICMSKKEFQVLELSDADSTELFCWNAFGQYCPLEKYEEITRRFVQYCGGLPLALEVLPLSLRGKGLDIWESQLAKLEDFPNKRIQDILSYGRIMMHQLIQEMGREVVRQEANNHPGQRSRL